MSTPLQTLLDVQAHDTRIDQLEHQLATIPAREERDAAAAAVAELDAAIAVDQEARDALGRDQKRLEDEIATLSDKRAHEHDTLYGGTVTNARALQDLQEEIESLGRRITHLEDQDLEIMEQVEPLDERIAEARRTREARLAVLADAEARVAAAEAELHEAIDAARAERDGVAAGVPAALLAEYEGLRKGRGGVGVAKLVGTQCGGCHLTLSAVEANRMRKLGADEVAHCEECGRILVP